MGRRTWMCGRNNTAPSFYWCLAVAFLTWKQGTWGRDNKLQSWLALQWPPIPVFDWRPVQISTLTWFPTASTVPLGKSEHNTTDSFQTHSNLPLTKSYYRRQHIFSETDTAVKQPRSRYLCNFHGKNPIVLEMIKGFFLKVQKAAEVFGT